MLDVMSSESFRPAIHTILQIFLRKNTTENYLQAKKKRLNSPSSNAAFSFMAIALLILENNSSRGLPICLNMADRQGEELCEIAHAICLRMQPQGPAPRTYPFKWLSRVGIHVLIFCITSPLCNSLRQNYLKRNPSHSAFASCIIDSK